MTETRNVPIMNKGFGRTESLSSSSVHSFRLDITDLAATNLMRFRCLDFQDGPKALVEQVGGCEMSHSGSLFGLDPW